MAQEYVLSEVNRKVKAQIAPGLRIVEIVPAKLANTAGMMGAVSLAEKLLAQLDDRVQYICLEKDFLDDSTGRMRQ